jgi:predicted ester cyclase
MTTSAPLSGSVRRVFGALHVSTETDKAIVGRFFDQAIDQRHYDVIDEVVASNFVLHSALLGEVHGGDAYKQSVLGLLNPCPDFHATVEDLMGAEGDTVVTRLTYRGTDTGGFVKGHAATGKPFEFGAIYIWRLSNGKLAELWQEADRVRLLQQLGILSA